MYKICVFQVYSAQNRFVFHLLVKWKSVVLIKQEHLRVTAWLWKELQVLSKFYILYIHFSYSLFSKTLQDDDMYRVQQNYLTILQNSCEWNRWRGEFVLERSSSDTQSISVAMERWSVERRAFAVETYFKNNDSVLTQRTFRRHFNIHRNECP